MIKYCVSIKTFQNKQQFITVSFSNKWVCKIWRPENKKTWLLELKDQEWENGKLVIEFLNSFMMWNFKKSDELKNKIKIDLKWTDFQKEVWTWIKSIKSGEALSYKELAEKIKRPKAVQAVGTACGKNPLPMLVPCHRVIASGGRIGGWSGKINKSLLLKREWVIL